MGTFIALLLIAGVVVYAKLRSRKTTELQLTAQSIARISYLRSGEFPATCSWCKSTTLARKLLIFERTSTGWSACDIMERLSHSQPGDVEALAPAMVQDQPRWRRLCTEKCTREFLASEHAPPADTFGPCEYCSTRFPVSIMRCNNCGAARR